MLPEELNEYIEAKAQVNKWTKKCEQLRPTVLSLLKKNNYEGIHWSRPKGNPKFDPALLYEFIKSKVPPEILTQVTIPVIDETKLDDLYADHYFELEDIPSECYSEGKSSDRINIAREKS